jgi:AraC-like DNA-binding protein
MNPQELANLAHLRRARDLIDREYARPLDVPTMARHAFMPPAHFSRQFRAAYGETPSAYRSREHHAVTAMPACLAKVRTRPTRNMPSRNGEAAREAAA